MDAWEKPVLAEFLGILSELQPAKGLCPVQQCSIESCIFPQLRPWLLCMFYPVVSFSSFFALNLMLFLINQPDFSAPTVSMHYLLTCILFSSEDTGSIHHIWTNNCSLLGINLVNLAGSESHCKHQIIPSSYPQNPVFCSIKYIRILNVFLNWFNFKNTLMLKHGTECDIYQILCAGVCLIFWLSKALCNILINETNSKYKGN